MLATENWCIKVEERVYGPYTQDQMASFASQGRLSGASLVSPAGGKQWREARQYPPLVNILTGKTTHKPKAFGKAAPEGPRELPEGAEAKFVIVFDVTAGTAGRVEPILRTLGTAFRLTDNVWVLTSVMSVLGVRNAISPYIDVREPLFIVDCSRGRTSWLNMVPELQAKLVRAWVKG